MKKVIALLALPLLLAACQASVIEDTNEVPTDEAAMEEGDVVAEPVVEEGTEATVEAGTEVEVTDEAAAQ